MEHLAIITAEVGILRNEESLLGRLTIQANPSNLQAIFPHTQSFQDPPIGLDSLTYLIRILRINAFPL